MLYRENITTIKQTQTSKSLHLMDKNNVFTRWVIRVPNSRFTQFIYVGKYITKIKIENHRKSENSENFCFLTIRNRQVVADQLNKNRCTFPCTVVCLFACLFACFGPKFIVVTPEPVHRVSGGRVCQPAAVRCPYWLVSGRPQCWRVETTVTAVELRNVRDCDDGRLYRLLPCFLACKLLRYFNQSDKNLALCVAVTRCLFSHVNKYLYCRLHASWRERARLFGHTYSCAWPWAILWLRAQIADIRTASHFRHVLMRYKPRFRLSWIDTVVFHFAELRQRRFSGGRCDLVAAVSGLSTPCDRAKTQVDVHCEIRSLLFSRELARSKAVVYA